VNIDDSKWHNLLALIEHDSASISDFINKFKLFLSLENIDEYEHHETWKSVLYSADKKETAFASYIKKTTYINTKKEILISLKHQHKEQGLKEVVYFGRLLESYMRFSAIENDGMDKAVSCYLFLAKYLIRLKAKAKSLYGSDSSNENHRELLKLLHDVYNQMILYKSDITENILYRLESLSEYGFVNQPLLSVICHYDRSSEKFALGGFSDGWTKNRFNSYYNFIINGISADNKARLLNIAWGFGKICRRDDGVLVAYPSIFKSGELRLIKPWFGFIFRGRMLLYTLFSDSYLQLSIFHKQKLADKFLNQGLGLESTISNDSLKLGLNNVIIAINSLDEESARVYSEYNPLWWIFSSYAINICKRWLSHIDIQKNNLLTKCVGLVLNILGKKDILLDLTSSKEGPHNFIKIVKLLTEFKFVDFENALKDINNDIGSQILENIFESLLFANQSGNKSALYLNALFNKDFEGVLIVVLGADTYHEFNDLNNILQNTPAYPIQDIHDLLLSLSHKFIFEKILADIDPSFVGISPVLTILLQSVINKEYVISGSLSDDRFNEALKSLPRGASGGLRFPGITSCPRVKAPNVSSAIDFLTQKNRSELTSLLSSLLYQESLDLELFLYPKAHRKLANAINIYRKSYSYVCPYLQQLILDCGDHGAKVSYGFDVAVQDLEAGKSLVSVLNGEYINCLRSNSGNLAADLTSLIQQHAFSMLEHAITSDDLCRINSILEGAYRRDAIFNSQSIVHDLDSYLDGVSENVWSRSLMKVITVLGRQTQVENYSCWVFRSLALYDKSYDLSDMLSYLKEAAVTNKYFWSCFGVSIAVSNHINNILSIAINNVYEGQEKYDFLEFMFENEHFCDFHDLYILKQQWLETRLLWQHQIKANSNLLFLESKSNFIVNANDELEFVIDELEGAIVSDAYDKYFQGVLQSLVKLIWRDFGDMVRTNLGSGCMRSLNGYKPVILKLLKLKIINLELSTQLKYLLWLINIEPYISTAPLRVYHSVQDCCPTSAWMNSLSLYLLLLGAYPEALQDKITVALGEYKCLINISGVLFFWQKQISDPYDNIDPFLLMPALKDLVDKTVHPADDNNARDEIYTQLEQECQRIEKSYCSRGVEYEDVQFLKVSLNTLQVAALGAMPEFQDNVDLLAAKINLLITGINVAKQVIGELDQDFIGINMFATFFNSPTSQKEDLCKTQISHYPC
jgi:hypothetical protein